MAKVSFNGTATFFLKSGAQIDVHCDELKTRTNNETGQLVSWSVDGACQIGKPHHINPSEVAAVTWNPIPVIVTANERAKRKVRV